MIKAYKKELKYRSYDEVKIINLDTGEFISYVQDKNIGFIFSVYNTNIFKMGYKSVKECLKSLKERNYLGQEVNYEDQIQSEKIGFIKLGVERIKRKGRINTDDFKDVIEKLSNYGLGFVDAQNQIIATYQHNLIEA